MKRLLLTAALVLSMIFGARTSTSSIDIKRGFIEVRIDNVSKTRAGMLESGGHDTRCLIDELSKIDATGYPDLELKIDSMRNYYNFIYQWR